MATRITDQETHMTVIDYQKARPGTRERTRSTQAYDDFEARLKDKVGKARIQARIQRLALGNPGRCRHLERESLN